MLPAHAGSNNNKSDLKEGRESMSENQQDLIEGLTVKMGRRELVIPPLNFKQLKRFQPKLEKIRTDSAGKVLGLAHMDDMAEIIHAAMTRNYPDITKDEVEDMLDLGNMNEVFNAVMKFSGLVKKPGEEKGPESR